LENAFRLKYGIFAFWSKKVVGTQFLPGNSGNGHIYVKLMKQHKLTAIILEKNRKKLISQVTHVHDSGIYINLKNHVT
jgi:hypothetical protein